MIEGDRLAPGTVLSRSYRVRRVLGQGGFGISYAAEELSTREIVAIKEYFPFEYAERRENGAVAAKRGHGAQFQKFHKDFRAEALALSRFDHPNIVHVLARFDANNTSYFVMEFISGDRLSDVVARSGPLEGPAVMLIAENLIEGAKTVHDQGLVHRDIKPSNIILGALVTPRPTRLKDIPHALMMRFGKPVLLDFGSARVTAPSGRPMTGLATPGYGAPEQWQERGVQDGRTDLYGLAATLYYCFAAAELPAAPDRARGHALEPAVGRFANVAPASFLAAIDKALALNPSERQRDIRALRAELFANLGASPAQSRRVDSIVAAEPPIRALEPARHSKPGPIDASVFAPKHLRAGETEVIYVVAHRPGLNPRTVLSRWRAAEDQTNRMHAVRVQVEADGASLARHGDTLAWSGDAAVFAVSVTADSNTPQVRIDVRVLLNDAQVAGGSFDRKTAAALSPRAELTRIKLHRNK